METRRKELIDYISRQSDGATMDQVETEFADVKLNDLKIMLLESIRYAHISVRGGRLFPYKQWYEDE